MGVIVDSLLPHLVAMDDDILSTGIVMYHLKVGSDKCNVLLYLAFPVLLIIFMMLYKLVPLTYYYTPCSNEVERGVYWFHIIRPSVHLSEDKIVSALYLPQY